MDQVPSCPLMMLGMRMHGSCFLVQILDLVAYLPSSVTLIHPRLHLKLSPLWAHGFVTAY